MFYRYSKINSGIIPWKFDLEKAVDNFLDNFLESNSVAEALSRLLREGFEDREYKLKGIEDILNELRQLKESMFQKYDISTAREDLVKRLEELIKKQVGAETFKGMKREYKNNYRQDEYVKKLADTLRKEIPPFTRDNIHKFEEGISRFNFRFTGESPLTFEEALGLFRKLQDIEGMERYLRNDEIENVNPSMIMDMLGSETAESLSILKHIIQQFESKGYIKTTEGRMELTPQGIRRIGEKTLRDIFFRLKKDSFGLHELKLSGRGDNLTGGTRKFIFGDSFDIDIVNTVKNSLRRHGRSSGRVSIEPEDFEVYEKETSTRISTALLLDMSWSMSWGNKFPAAKKVAIAMEELLRTRFPQDKLFIIGFFTVAVELKPYQLPSLDLNLNDPFTNIQDALLLADKLLMRESNSNKYVILITDGQPTAYFEAGILEVEWPVLGVSPRAFEKTLQAVHLLSRHNIKIDTFMLDTNPVLVHFVEEMMKINHGRAFFTTPEEIGKYLVVDYFENKRRLIV